MTWIIPFTAALALWAANWTLIRLAMWPIRFIGIPPYLGWQGLLARKSPSIARRLAESVTTRLATVGEAFEVLGPRRIAEHVDHTVRPRLSEIVEDTVLECRPRLWDALDDACKRHIVVQMQKEVPGAVGQILDVITERIEDFADLEELTRHLLAEQPQLLVRMISEIGSREFRFLVNAGLYFGVFFGMVQMILWMVKPVWWILPASGFCAGILINWMAITLVFHPVNPRRIGPFRIHGMFVARQEEAAVVSTRIFTRDVISIQNLMNAIVNGRHGDEVHDLIRDAYRPVVHNALESRQNLILEVIGMEGFEALEDLLLERLFGATVVTFDDPVFNHERQVAIEHTYLDRTLELTSEEFQNLLRPAIQEEERLLILGGGVTAMIAGFLLEAVLVTLA